ncbi:MAG: SDR family oxidoreductase [Bacteroidota bacterium]
MNNNIPMKRIGTPEEFAQTVCFLASEGAGYITGTALQIDGGFIQGLF